MKRKTTFLKTVIVPYTNEWESSRRLNFKIGQLERQIKQDVRIYPDERLKGRLIAHHTRNGNLICDYEYQIVKMGASDE